ncbi:MAG: four helix bundle protein [bacterium]
MRAFQCADELVLLFYEITRTFPREEIYGLTSQLRRAAVSVLALGNMSGTVGEYRGKNNLLIGEKYPLTALLDWSNFAVLNLSDQSGVVFPWFTHSLNDNTEILLVG